MVRFARPPISADLDVLQSLTGRFISATRLFACNESNWQPIDNDLGFLNGVDSVYADVGTKTPEELMLQSVRFLAAIRKENEMCADPVIREWFERVLAAIQTTLSHRLHLGYNSPWGLCYGGNPFRAIDQALDSGVGQLEDAPDRVREWDELRQLILYKRGRRKEKVERLNSWFAG